MGPNIGKEIADLKQMSVRELREKYEAAFGEPTRAGNKGWLFKQIAWRIQALAERDLPERARRRAEFLARDADLRTTAPRAHRLAGITPAAVFRPNDRQPGQLDVMAARPARLRG